jgi:hypothetical protein
VDRASAVQLRDAVAEAFPSKLGPEVDQVVQLLVPSRSAPVGYFEVSVREQRLRIPYRIYEDPPPPGKLDDLGELARAALHCLFTRHHDGHVRQQHAEKIISVDADWVTPFVVALLGEYVIEIVDAVRVGLAALDTLGTRQRRRYGRFAADNPGFMSLTRQRAVSYWDCYYRRQYPEFGRYPAAHVLASLNSAATDYMSGS